MTFGNGNCISEDAFLDTILVYIFSIQQLNDFCQYLLQNTMNNRFDVRKKQKVKRTPSGTSNSMLPDRKQHLMDHSQPCDDARCKRTGRDASGRDPSFADLFWGSIKLPRKTNPMLLAAMDLDTVQLTST